MKKRIWIPALILMSMGVANAEEHLGFSLELPCIDGWSACLVSGEVLDISSVKIVLGNFILHQCVLVSLI